MAISSGELLTVEVLDYASLAPIVVLKVDLKTSIGALKAQIAEHIAADAELITRIDAQEMMSPAITTGETHESNKINKNLSQSSLVVSQKRPRSSYQAIGASAEAAIALITSQGNQRGHRCEKQTSQNEPSSCLRDLKWYREVQGPHPSLTHLPPDVEADALTLSFLLSAEEDQGEITGLRLLVEAVSPREISLSHLLRLLREIQESSEGAERADEILHRHPYKPLHAFWEALHIGEKPAVLVAMVRDSRCGMERRVLEDEDVTEIGIQDTLSLIRFDTTPLMLAVIAGRLDVVVALVDHGADVNAIDDYGLRPLSLAIRTNNFEIIKFLTPKTDLSRSFPLHTAAEDNNIEAIKLLFALGCTINTNNEDGSPLHFATSPEAVEYLISQNCNVGQTFDQICEDYTALDHLICHSQVSLEAVGLVISHGTPMLSTLLMSAARFGHTRVAEMLLDNGCYMDGPCLYGEPPLLEAILNGHVEIAQMLIENGCAINGVVDKANKSALQLCVEKGYVRIVKMLLSAGADPVDSNGHSLLHFAISERLPEVTYLLIEKSDLSRVDILGRTPLHWSLFITNTLAGLTIIPKLLEHGSDVNARCGNYQRQPLHIAAGGEDASRVQQLLDCGSDIDARDHRNRLPLYIAHDPAILRVLLHEMGAERWGDND